MRISRLFTRNLYVKIGLWMILNLLLLVGLGVGVGWYMLIGNVQGIVPASLFSSDVDGVLRVISANLQYRSALTWKNLLHPYDTNSSLRFHLATLDTETILDKDIPDSMFATAKDLPRGTYEFCPAPEDMFWDTLGGKFFARQGKMAEYGLPPVPPVLFIHTSNPSRYWYGRVLAIPDNNQQIHTVLLALESDTLNGHGLFFNFKLIILIGVAVLGISVLWWIPFIRHISRPLLKMVAYAEQAEKDNFSKVDSSIIHEAAFSGVREDEVGRLGLALVSMIQRVNRLVTGQSQFIRYVAHELNTPLAKAQLGLGVLEDRLDGDLRVRVQKIIGQIKRLSVLTDEVLSYLQAKAAMEAPKYDFVELCSFLSTLVRSEAQDYDVHVLVEENTILWIDPNYLRRIIGNLLRNAITYAGDAGAIIIEAKHEGKQIRISVRDHGPGVPPVDLPQLTEAFYRGHALLTHPGGTGLGLSIVKYCTERCGGKFEYGNVQPHGFQAAVLFPLSSAD